MKTVDTKVIAHIESAFNSKFGIPRQSGVVPELKARIIMEPEFRNPDAFRLLEGFSHIWLLWHFSKAVRETWSPTVRPPILGGNTRAGVFATRSPFRPNPIGLSCVRLESIELDTSEGPVLTVSGADLMNGTPILDSKPYVPYADAHPEASGGFTSKGWETLSEVVIPPQEQKKVPSELLVGLYGVLRNDPRPQYHEDSDRLYGMEFGNLEIKFHVSDKVLFVDSIKCLHL